MSEFAETLKKLTSNKAVKFTVVYGKEYEVLFPEKTEKNKNALDRMQKYVPPLIEKAKLMIRNLDATNDLTFIHFKSGKEELMIAPGDEEVLVVLSDLSRLDKADF